MPDENGLYVKAGKLFCFSEGEYSDYGYCGHFLALEDITTELFERTKDRIKAQIAEGIKDAYGDIVNADSDHYEKSSIMARRFLPELIRQGAIMDIDCTEIHLRSYGRLEL
jgi:hypothetical protein